MPETLDRKTRLSLMRFVCSTAWADLEIRPQEREFVVRLVARMGLDGDEKRQVMGWLEVPPPPDEIDPMGIPRAHRDVFMEAIEAVVVVDGEVAPEEREHLDVLKELLSS